MELLENLIANIDVAPTQQSGTYSCRAGYSGYTYYTIQFPQAFAKIPTVSLDSDTFATTVSNVSITGIYFGAKRRYEGNTTTGSVKWTAAVV